jgi:hypothetical protein
MKSIREEMESIARERNGLLLPEQIVESARNPNSSMHDEFTWDDSEAANAYRLTQARALIKRVKVEIVRPDNKPINIPVFIRSPGGKGYESAAKVLHNKPDRHEVLLMTIAQVIGMLKNTGSSEVDGVVIELEAIREKVRLQYKRRA